MKKFPASPRSCTVVVLLALASCAGPQLDPRWSASAEEQLRAIEKRYLDAPSLQWSSESTIELRQLGSEKVTAELRVDASFKGSDKFKVACRIKGIQGMAPTIQSDGQRLRMAPGTHGDIGSDKDVPKDSGRIFRVIFFRAGFPPIRPGSVFTNSHLFEDIDRQLAVSEVRYGPEGRIQDREARAILYELRMKGSDPITQITLWIDLKTLAILKRESRDAKGATTTEMFLTTDFKAALPDETFALPKDAKEK